MALIDDIPVLLDGIKKNTPIIEHNSQLFDIYEGDLLKYILADLKKQLGQQSYEAIQHRVSPVNILKRVVEKLAKLYQRPPMRELLNESEKDKELMDLYSFYYSINSNMAHANELGELFKNTLLEPYVYKGKPRLRIVPSDRFYAYSNNRIDPTCPTHIVKMMGQMKIERQAGKEEYVELYYAYTDGEFLPFDSNGDVRTEILAMLDNPEGKNIYGRIPFVYINKSKHSLIPPPDTDSLRMTKIFPILLSDLNFAVMYQAFSIVYGIDVDDENITMSPNAFWRFKSDPSSQNKPEIGVIKPQVDIQQVVGFMASQLAFWLQSKNIRPGSVGELSAENFQSGVSKIVDEMDTYEARQKQVPLFKWAEEDLWDLTINHLHPIWIQQKLLDETRLFDKGQEVVVTFPEQKPITARSEILANLKEELSMALTTRKEAIMRLNPEMSEEEALEFIMEIDEESTIEVPSEQMDQSENQNIEPVQPTTEDSDSTGNNRSYQEEDQAGQG